MPTTFSSEFDRHRLANRWSPFPAKFCRRCPQKNLRWPASPHAVSFSPQVRTRYQEQTMADIAFEPVDPGGLLEFSVVYTDRSLNHMSAAFQGVMCDLSATLKDVYGARSAVIVPGGGTYGMEAVARQFATGNRCLVLRNGWFSYRWTQIFETGGLRLSRAYSRRVVQVRAARRHSHPHRSRRLFATPGRSWSSRPTSRRAFRSRQAQRHRRHRRAARMRARTGN